LKNGPELRKRPSSVSGRTASIDIFFALFGVFTPIFGVFFDAILFVSTDTYLLRAAGQLRIRRGVFQGELESRV